MVVTIHEGECDASLQLKAYLLGFNLLSFGNPAADSNDAPEFLKHSSDFFFWWSCTLASI